MIILYGCPRLQSWGCTRVTLGKERAHSLRGRPASISKLAVGTWLAHQDSVAWGISLSFVKADFSLSSFKASTHPVLDPSTPPVQELLPGLRHPVSIQEMASIHLCDLGGLKSYTCKNHRKKSHSLFGSDCLQLLTPGTPQWRSLAWLKKT